MPDRCLQFDLENLTKQFYKGYKALFERLQVIVKQWNPNSYFESPDRCHAFCQNLLGRIMVLYFLQSKSLLGDDRHFLSQQYRQLQADPAATTYYTAILEPLFYETLNQPSPNLASFWGEIPYLNSHLCDRDNGEDSQTQADEDTTHPVQLPNTLFDPDRPDSILAFFNRYNFTLDENSQGDETVAIDPEMLGTVFENLLAEEARGRSGTFYTPRAIVQFMAESALVQYLADHSGLSNDTLQALLHLDPDTPILPQLLSQEQAQSLQRTLTTVKILDPAVGSGAFLLGMVQVILAMRQVIARCQGTIVPPGSPTIRQWKQEIITNNLYGIDIEPTAIALVKLRLWFFLISDNAPGNIQPLPNLDDRLVCGDALCTVINKEPLQHHSPLRSVFQPGGFDIVIGNPPYVDSETMTRTQPKLREDYAARFKTATGNWDLFILFIEKGIDLLKPGGILAYILPNKLIGAKYARPTRDLIRTLNLLELRDYSSVRIFKEAHVYPVACIVQNSPPQKPVTMTKMNDIDHIGTRNQIQPALFYRGIDWDIYFLPPQLLAIFEKLSALPKLSDFFDAVKGAATVNEAYLIKAVVREHTDDLHEPFKKLVNTGTIDPYQSRWSTHPTQYLKTAYMAPIVLDKDLAAINPTRLLQAQSPKVIIAGMSRGLECFYDPGECLAGKSTTIILPGQIDLRVITAFLNSRLLSFWYGNYYQSIAMSGGYLSVNNNEIKTIPIPNSSTQQQEQLIQLVTELQHQTHRDNSTELIQAVDEIVYGLYGLDRAEINLIGKGAN